MNLSCHANVMSILGRLRPRILLTRHAVSAPRSVSTALLSRRPLVVHAPAAVLRTAHVRSISFLPRLLARQIVRLGVVGAGGASVAGGAALYANNKFESFVGAAGDFAGRTWQATSDKVTDFSEIAGGGIATAFNRVNNVYASASAAADESWESLAGALSGRFTLFRDNMKERFQSNDNGEEDEHNRGSSGGDDGRKGAVLAAATAAVETDFRDDHDHLGGGYRDSSSDLMNLTAKLIEIRTLLQSIDHSDNLVLPSIVVVGSQSSGKSSVLEAIVGHHFLPKGDNMVTRRPIELTLVHTPPTELTPSPQEYAEIPTLGNTKITDFSQVQKMLTDLNLAVPVDEAVSEEPIYLRIHSPRVPNLSLVDLPGYVQLSSADQPEHLRDRITRLCDRYIRSPNIILAVCAANVDLANSASLRASRMVDPLGTRTIGVITKLDLVEPELGASILNNDRYPLKLGYVGVVCKPPPPSSFIKSEGLALLRRGSSNDDSLHSIITKQEREFFEANRESYGQLGVSTALLKRRLMEVLERSMSASLSSISSAVDAELAETRYKFKVQYNDRLISAESYVAETMDHLKSRMNEFQKAFGKKAVQQVLKQKFDSRILDVLATTFFEDVNAVKDLGRLGNSGMKADDLDPTWSYKLDHATDALTKSFVGRTSTNLVKEILESSVDNLLSEEPMPFHPIASERIKTLASAIINDRLHWTADQVENAIKPLKYEIDVDEREWEQGRKKAIDLLKTDLDECKRKLDMNRKEGGRKLTSAMEYVKELEADAQRKAARKKLAASSEEGDNSDYDRPDDIHRPLFNPYLLSKARESLFLDKLSGILLLRIKALQSKRCVSGVDNKSFCPEVFLNIVADKLAYTSVNFINIELLHEFFYQLPRAIDMRLGGEQEREEMVKFSKENPSIRDHLDLQERKRKLEKVAEELTALVTLQGTQNPRRKERPKGGLFGLL